MKTISLQDGHDGIRVAVEFNELELTALAALVEQGQRYLPAGRASALHRCMHRVAEEFLSLLGHLELSPADR